MIKFTISFSRAVGILFVNFGTTLKAVAPEGITSLYCTGPTFPVKTPVLFAIPSPTIFTALVHMYCRCSAS